MRNNYNSNEIPSELISLLNKSLVPFTKSFLNKAGVDYAGVNPSYKTKSNTGEVVLSLHIQVEDFPKVVKYYNNLYPDFIDNKMIIDMDHMGLSLGMAMNSTILYNEVLPTLDYKQYIAPSISRQQSTPIYPKHSYSEQYPARQPLLQSKNLQEYNQQNNCCGGCIMM